MSTTDKQRDPTDLSDLDESIGDTDSLADALFSALKDADEAIAKRGANAGSMQAAVEDVEDLTDSLDELPEEVLETLPEIEEPVSALPAGDPAPAKEAGAKEKELLDKYLRLAAEFENYKKRQVREKEEYQRFSQEKTLVQLLPVIDNFERALFVHETQQGSANALIDGVRMIHRQFKDVLGKLGLHPFESLGKPFDPAKHQAVMLRERSDVVPGMVVEEFQRGYFLHERLIRPAMVVVSQAATQTAEPVPSADSTEPSDSHPAQSPENAPGDDAE